MNKSAEMDDKAYQLQATLLQALAHPTRLRILNLLRQASICVCEMEDMLAIRQATISQHLAILRAAGLVEARREGVRMAYQVTDPRVYQVLDILAQVIHDQHKVAHEALRGSRTAGSGP